MPSLRVYRLQGKSEERVFCELPFLGIRQLAFDSGLSVLDSLE
jgi:hypothetical protein